jgi:hypothetical protein
VWRGKTLPPGGNVRTKGMRRIKAAEGRDAVISPVVLVLDDGGKCLPPLPSHDVYLALAAPGGFGFSSIDALRA